MPERAPYACPAPDSKPLGNGGYQGRRTPAIDPSSLQSFQARLGATNLVPPSPQGRVRGLVRAAKLSTGLTTSNRRYGSLDVPAVPATQPISGQADRQTDSTL